MHPLNDFALKKARLYVELTVCQIVGICRESFKPGKKQIIPEAFYGLRIVWQEIITDTKQNKKQKKKKKKTRRQDDPSCFIHFLHPSIILPSFFIHFLHPSFDPVFSIFPPLLPSFLHPFFHPVSSIFPLFFVLCSIPFHPFFHPFTSFSN